MVVLTWRFGGPIEFEPYLSCRRWLLPGATQQRSAKGTDVVDSVTYLAQAVQSLGRPGALGAGR